MFKVFLSLKDKRSHEIVGVSCLVRDYESLKAAKRGASDAALDTDTVFSEIEIREYDDSVSNIIGGEQDTCIRKEKYILLKE